MSEQMEAHGYGPYTHGCRCGICRAAKAEYTRQRRAAGRALAQQHGTAQSPNGRHFVPGITHGRFGYEERGCRCLDCCAARATEWRERKARRVAAEDAA